MWNMEEKVDGTNIRLYWKNEQLEIKGRTDNAQLHPELINNLTEWFTPKLLTSVFGSDNFILYGEGYGAGIQKGGGYRQDKFFILFDVSTLSDNPMFLTREAIKDIAKKLDIQMCPHVAIGNLSDAIMLCREGFKSQLREQEPEGLVIRPLYELNNRRGERIITKLKLKDFQ
jgi:hypothetical protein